jgi:hypothetical protein
MPSICFVICYPCAGINGVSNINELPPDWDTSDDIINLSAGKRWALLAIWSFDDKKVNAILKKMHKHPSQQDLNVISFAFLAMITGTERRDVLARLFAMLHLFVPGKATVLMSGVSAPQCCGAIFSHYPARIRFPAIPHAIHRADKRLLGVQRLQLAAQVLMWLSMVRSVTTR